MQDSSILSEKSTTMQPFEVESASVNTTITEKSDESRKSKHINPILPFTKGVDKTLQADHVIALLASTIGSTVLMISSAMAASGVIWSTIQMIGCAGLSYFSLVTTIKCATGTQLFNLREIAATTYGSWCKQFVNFLSFFIYWGTIILDVKLGARLIIASLRTLFGTTAPTWLTSTKNEWLVLIIATFIILPLCLSRKYTTLRYFNVLNVFFLITLCLVTLWEGFDYQPLWQGFRTTDYFILKGFQTTLPTAIFTFTLPTEALDVFKDMKHATIEEMKKVVRYTTIIILVSYTFIGLIGYATFSGNLGILSDTNRSNTILLIGYGYNLNGTHRGYSVILLLTIVVVALALFLAQPFNIKFARLDLKNFLSTLLNFKIREKMTNATIRRLVFTIIVLYSVVLVDALSDNAQLIVNFIGSTLSPLMCFVLPSLLYLKINSSMSIVEKILHILMIVISLMFTVWNTLMTLDDASS